MKFNPEDIEYLPNYDWNFICNLADYCYKEIELPRRLRSNWSYDGAYRKRVMRELQKEREEGRATEVDVEMIKRAHYKPKKSELQFTMKDASVYGVRGRGSGERDRRLNIEFWRLIGCLKEGLGIENWEHISSILHSLRWDNGTPLIKAEWDAYTLQLEWSKRKNLFKGFHFRNFVEILRERSVIRRMSG